MEDRLIYKGRIFELVQKDVILNGKKEQRDLIIHNGGVALCVVKDNQLLLVSQSRTGAGCRTLEIPAGTLEPGEDPAECGRRELNEEAGLECGAMKLITAFWPTPGYDTEVIYVYDCQDPRPAAVRRPMDETEDIEIEWMDLDLAAKKIEDGSIRDGKTIIAVYYSLLQRQTA
ncbi:MAG: NUDIX hydrolase [Ileibacterium sp.]|nr:NUDIX hydrolase [Ileibacterium sp.]